MRFSIALSLVLWAVALMGDLVVSQEGEDDQSNGDDAPANVVAAVPSAQNATAPTTGKAVVATAPSPSVVAAVPVPTPSVSGSGGSGSSSSTSVPTVAEATDLPTTPPFTAPPVPPRQDCYGSDDLDALQLIVGDKDPFTKEVFVLCPNTIFDIGRNNDTNYCCFDGGPPLWPRKFTTYQCGEDGKSSNNCILRGGQTQTTAWSDHYNGERKTEAVYRGITFENADSFALLMADNGEYVFDDCIFQNHTGFGAIKLMNFIPRQQRELSDSERSAMKRTDAAAAAAATHAYHGFSGMGPSALATAGAGRALDSAAHRQLQEEGVSPVEVLRQRVVFNNCLFQHNKPGIKGETTHYGVIKVETGLVDLVVNNSIFLNNVFEHPSVIADSFGIQVHEGSSLEIHNTCFLGNNFEGQGAVMVPDAATIVAHTGNYATADPYLDCPFINVDDASCIDYTGKTCLADRYALLLASGSLPENAIAPPTPVEMSSNESDADLPATSGAIQAAVTRTRLLLVLIVGGCIALL